MLSPNNQRQHRTSYAPKDVLPLRICANFCALCQPLVRAFPGWIRSPPPTILTHTEPWAAGGAAVARRHRGQLLQCRPSPTHHLHFALPLCTLTFWHTWIPSVCPPIRLICIRGQKNPIFANESAALIVKAGGWADLLLLLFCSHA